MCFGAVRAWAGGLVGGGYIGNGTGLDGYLRTSKVTRTIDAFALELLPSEIIHGDKWMETTRRIHFATGISDGEVGLRIGWGMGWSCWW